ncbi:hypothetical protein HMI55_003641 [Coelomomyces lativittatus]|nr:hypothetical protein HMI55_003641 [Coelomomyces lativittatus]
MFANHNIAYLQICYFLIIHYLALTDNYLSFSYFFKLFIGTTPTPFLQLHFDTLLESDYFCTRYFGSRHLLFIQSNNNQSSAYLINTQNQVFQVKCFVPTLKDPKKSHHETLLDGELISGKDFDTQIVCIFSFKVIVSIFKFPFNPILQKYVP